MRKATPGLDTASAHPPWAPHFSFSQQHTQGSNRFTPGRQVPSEQDLALPNLAPFTVQVRNCFIKLTLGKQLLGELLLNYPCLPLLPVGQIANITQGQLSTLNPNVLGCECPVLQRQHEGRQKHKDREENSKKDPPSLIPSTKSARIYGSPALSVKMQIFMCLKIYFPTNKYFLG